MTQPYPNQPAEGYVSEGHNDCGVSWGAVFGGAAVAASVSLALVVLGSALGLSTVSPNSNPETAASVAAKAAIWLIIMQWIASGLGGYLTGRLRIKWATLHTDEVFFRDTAHGFLTWSVATLVTAIFLTSAASSVLGVSTKATATVAAGTVAGSMQENGPGKEAWGNTAYYTDSLFRTTTPNAAAPAADTRAETVRILVMGAKNGSVSDDDKAYLTQLVSARAGISTDEAAKRVDNVIGEINTDKEKAKEAAETARKLAMHTSIFIFLSLLIGAFIASAAAAIGGRQRDMY